MKRLAALLAALCLAMLALAGPAGAAFGLKELDLAFEEEDGSPAIQAGSHPFAMTTTLAVNAKPDPQQVEIPEDTIKDLKIDFPPGLVGNPSAVPTCDSADFVRIVAGGTSCPDDSVVGVAALRVALPFEPPTLFHVGVYNLVPPPGVAAKVGFVALGVPVTIDAGVNPDPPYNLFVSLDNVPQAVRFFGSVVSVWGNPASSVHDGERGRCATSGGECPVSLPEKPFLTLPRSCSGPLPVDFKTDSWQEPGAWLDYPIQSPDGMSGCTSLGFAPQMTSEPTARSTESSSGLNFHLDVEDKELVSPTGHADSDIKRTVVTLPEGVTVNPSVAEGLATCSEDDFFKRETLDSEPGEGCPQASKVGEVEVETPLLEGELLEGSIFAATQDENPFHSMIALYMVIKDPKLGILVKLPGKVTPNEKTGQLETTFGEPPYEIPQFPFSHFRFHFREGARAPLVTPSTCGRYETRAVFTPWANPSTTLTKTSSFEIEHGVGGGPCPPQGAPPFKPGFEAGSVDNHAGSYSPFYVHLTRADGEQEITRLSSVLPPGVVGKIAGLAKCPDSAIAAAKAKTGRAELASPSCSAGSRIGRTLGGVGVGSTLTYAPGSLYLGGPVAGDPLSVIAITPAVAGPFDAGTVVVREALTLDPETAEVQIDGAHSDPIPHILKGIPLRLRDLRVYVDRPNFTLNPTSCDPEAVKATLFGSFADVFSSADDVPVALDSRYQAAGCAKLGFKPKLSLRLKGGTKRNDHPAFRAVLTPRAGDANSARIAVTLPHSAFLEQGHIRTVCTRVQFAANQCPKGSIYGRARAISPLLDEPLKGNVYLRSSSHPLPDMVLALKGVVDFNAVGRIDSIRGRIRNTFDFVPDVPVTRVILELQGGKKGLIVNSRNLCARTSRAIADFTAQNGKGAELRPVVHAKCPRAKHQGSRHHR
jgi:hypothetical protein